MSSNLTSPEAIPLTCRACRGQKWYIFLELDPIEKRVYLCYTCTSRECVESMRDKYGAGTPYWGRLDITGQGYDPPEWNKIRSVSN